MDSLRIPDEDDERILHSGERSDVLVRCGTQSWRLHKTILQTRCMYFSTGIDTAWMLGNPLFFYVDEQDVEAVWWIITWIYIRCLPGELCVKDGSIFTACLRLIRCSRVFLLPPLTAYALQHLYNASQNMMIDAQFAFIDAEDSDAQFEMSELDGFFDGVKKAYEDDDLQAEKQYFIDVVQGAHFWPMLDSNFKDKAQAIPEFWNDIMILQHEAIIAGNYWPYTKPDECHVCKQSPWESDDLIHWASLKLVKGKCQATCNRCAKEKEEKIQPTVDVENEQDEEETSSVGSDQISSDDESKSSGEAPEVSPTPSLKALLKVYDGKDASARMAKFWTRA
ncbi:BTB/POZ protein [Apiospora arundinis]|uniref:BTB/POZ protein n=1 Tax=Apiospora arundinis TaxID=335852 RepID=A0ABR2I9K1_9PEZI